MSDPLTSDTPRAVDASSAADRDAKIEQLLLVGLDHYFAAQYEQAINVWTRALFLDRSHPRARAYIERARSALAERQRESEELLHSGVEAFQRGEGREARRLLRAAIAGGAPSDEALVVLDRLDRLDAGTTVRVERGAPETRPAAPARTPPSSPSKLRSWLAMSGLMLAAGALAAFYASGRWNRLQRYAGLVESPVSAARPIARDTALPLPRRGETALAHARALLTAGRLREALAALDGVRLTDPERPDADRLRSDIQRQLLTLGAAKRVP